MIGQFAAFALQQFISAKAAAGNTVGDVRSYFTAPKTGVQTVAGQTLAQINEAYLSLRDAGQVTADVIQAAIDETERLRAGFESHVRSLNEWMQRGGGSGAVATINAVAETQKAALRSEFAKFGFTPPASSGAIGGDSVLWVLIIIVVVFLLIRR